METSQNSALVSSNDDQALKKDLDRLLEIGRILRAVLTEEELEQLQMLLSDVQNR